MPPDNSLLKIRRSTSSARQFLAEPPSYPFRSLDNLFDIAACPNDIQVAGVADEREHRDHLAPRVVHGRADRCNFGVAFPDGHIEPVRTNFLEQCLTSQCIDFFGHPESMSVGNRLKPCMNVSALRLR
jgi:hypothetical protein